MWALAVVRNCWLVAGHLLKLDCFQVPKMRCLRLEDSYVTQWSLKAEFNTVEYLLIFSSKMNILMGELPVE